jgi:hypothetical protein
MFSHGRATSRQIFKFQEASALELFLKNHTHTHIQNIYFRFTLFTLSPYYCSDEVLRTNKGITNIVSVCIAAITLIDRYYSTGRIIEFNPTVFGNVIGKYQKSSQRSFTPQIFLSRLNPVYHEEETINRPKKGKEKEARQLILL